LRYGIVADILADMPKGVKERLTLAERDSLASLVRRWLEHLRGERVTVGQLRAAVVGPKEDRTIRQVETQLGHALSAAARLGEIFEGRRIVKGRDGHTKQSWYELRDAEAEALREKRAALLEERRKASGVRIAPEAVDLGVQAVLVECRKADEGRFRRVVYDVITPGSVERLRFETKIPIEAFESEHQMDRSGLRLRKSRGAVTLAERILRQLGAEIVAGAVSRVPAEERPEPLSVAAAPFGQE
jgi:hypothetical protein